MTIENYSQIEQDKVPLEIIIRGGKPWQDYLQEISTLDEMWTEICGAKQLPLIDAIRKEAEINVVSFERCVVNHFLTEGYTLEELVVHFRDETEALWGICTWYKDHPNYEDPEFVKKWPGVHKKWLGFIGSTYKTEHAGDQRFGLFSMQMFGAQLLGMKTGILLHKTLVYHKVVFSPPVEEPAVAAAA